MIIYRALNANELTQDLFSAFTRRQTVTKCLRMENGEWQVKDAPFVDDWTKEDYRTLITCLRNTLATGGFIYAAFLEGALKGFVSVEAELFGPNRDYLDLSSLHVSEEMRGQGIGKALFSAAKVWALEHGAEKLYISSHSAVESQAFYQAMGCVDAQFRLLKHVEKEPYDRQLECIL